MKKIFILLLLLSLCIPCFTQEIIEGVENEQGETVLTKSGIEILNEELRKLRDEIKEIKADIETLQAFH